MIKKNTIALAHRPYILTYFKRVLYANSVSEMEDMFENFLSDKVISYYKNFVSYINKVYEDREEWALCFWKDIPMRGNDTNNFIEAQFLVIKDDILKRQKEVNVVGLLQKLTHELC